MKKTFITLMIIFFYATGAGTEESKKITDSCFAEFKISPSTLACNFKRGINKLITKEDGSYNFLGKFFNAKSGKDLIN